METLRRTKRIGLQWTERKFVELIFVFVCEGPLPPADWPSEGEIEFQDVSLQYSAELDPVVRNFSVHIKAGQKVDHSFLRLWCFLFLFAIILASSVILLLVSTVDEKWMKVTFDLLLDWGRCFLLLHVHPLFLERRPLQQPPTLVKSYFRMYTQMYGNLNRNESSFRGVGVRGWNFCVIIVLIQ